MSNSKTQEFIIKFDNVNLSPEASARIQHGINSLILQELASHNPSAAGGASDDGDYCGIYIPHKWIGRQVINVNVTKPGSLVLPGATLSAITQR